MGVAIAHRLIKRASCCSVRASLIGAGSGGQSESSDDARSSARDAGIDTETRSNFTQLFPEREMPGETSWLCWGRDTPEDYFLFKLPPAPELLAPAMASRITRARAGEASRASAMSSQYFCDRLPSSVHETRLDPERTVS